MRRVPVLVAAAAAVALAVSGCSGSSSGPPDFRPSPTGGDVEGPHGVHVSPIQPVPSLGGSGRGGGGGSGAPSASAPSGGQAEKTDPVVVATRLKAPTGLSLLPDNTALVGERTTGRIVRVQPKAGQPVPTVRVLHGLSTVGGGGLLDLAVSPHYTEDNLIYAYITTATDNRVVDFTLDGPVTPVLTGIPRGRSGNAGRIAFGSDGDLYIGTGDAGRPALADKPGSLAGKVLRVNDIGHPAPGNPRTSSPVFTTGVDDLVGVCPSPSGMLAVRTTASGRPTVGLITKGRIQKPLVTLPKAADGPGGCAALDGRLWVTSLDGQAVFSSAPNRHSGGFGKFTAALAHRYGRLLTVVPAQDGALWMTTSNRDGHGHPVRADERVLRYVPQASGGGAGSTT